MDFYRHVAAGRLSELVGEGGVDVDILMRTLALYSQGQRLSDCMPQEPRDEITAYISGINAYLDSEPNLPIEYQILGLDVPAHWTIQDVSNVAHLFQWQLSRNYDDDIERFTMLLKAPVEILHTLYPDYASDAPTIHTALDIVYNATTCMCDVILL